MAQSCPSRYLSAPALSWDAMLNMTNKSMNNVACGKTSENLKLIKMDVKTKPHVIKNI